MKETLVIVPCYNAEKTIKDVIIGIKKSGFSNIVIGDDCSTDNTIEIINNEFPNTPLIKQDLNLGYGGNQKALYNYAINHNFKYVIMIHGDNQYTPFLVPVLFSMLKYGKYDFVFGSRITGGNAIKGGMPLYKYISNRLLTLLQNFATNYKLSEYHSGLRGYKCSALESICYTNYSDDFIFDNQVILGVIKKKMRIGEVSCETIYNHQSSSIGFKKSIIYGFRVLLETFKYLMSRE